MKARVDCIVCMFRQALNTARVVSDDPDIHLEILRRTAARVAHPDFNRTPAALSQPVYEIVSEVTGVADPYGAHKRETNRIALEHLPHVEALVNAAPDPLDAALHAAAAGNVIDLGIGQAFDIDSDIERIMRQSLAINAVAAFRRELGPGRRILYLGDNAGEIVFDTLLVRRIAETGAEVTVSVKSGPIINDATREDAAACGMTELAAVIETGAADIGVNWDRISPEFRDAVDRADAIVAKGHGNFETCNDRPENFYFLLKAKCAMVANELGVSLGDIVFKHSAGAGAQMTNRQHQESIP